MQDIIEKLKSDRLWMTVAYLGLLFGNAWFGWEIPDDMMTNVMYVVLAFVIGKSLRGTVPGNLLAAAVPMITSGLQDAKVKHDEKKAAEEVSDDRTSKR